jgi:hypothetical protein
MTPSLSSWRISLAAAAFVVLAASGNAAAQTVDLTLFVGRAFPTYDERFTLRPPAPTLPGVEVDVVRSPELQADGGPVFGGALAVEWGIFGIEGRLDATNVGLEFTGARYDLRGTQPPFQGQTASIIVSEGRFDADTIALLSANVRLRTPGPVGLVASGGLSYLPGITVTGVVPLSVEAPGVPAFPPVDAGLRIRAVAGEADDQWGVNGGLGLRFGGRVAVIGEVRAFYFPVHELRFDVDGDLGLFDDLLDDLDPIRFSPVFVNAQVGVSFRF